ncbi:MAG: response regulator [bacterium]
MKSLVVDDDFTCAFMYKLQLSKYGQCDTFSNGLDAIKAYEASLNSSNPYDLMLIDIMMPDMNGYEVLKIIREIEEEKLISFPFNAKIILTTGLDDTENRQNEKELDHISETYLVKSNDPNALMNKLILLGFEYLESN